MLTLTPPLLRAVLLGVLVTCVLELQLPAPIRNYALGGWCRRRCLAAREAEQSLVCPAATAACTHAH